MIEQRQGGVQSVDNLNNFYKRADEKTDEILPPIIIGEVFIRIDTEVDVVQFIYAPEDNDYIGLDPKLQVIKANTRLYILEDKDDNLYVSLDEVV